MPGSQHESDPSELAELTASSREVIATVRRWLAVSADIPVDSSARRLAEILKDPRGLPFAVSFVDGVIRPEDSRVAARNLSLLADDLPTRLPATLRSAIRLGAACGKLTPGLVIPVVRRVLRHMVGHLVVDARPEKLGKAIRRIRRHGVRLNLNLLGEAVLGSKEAARRLEGTQRLLARDDVDYVSIKVSASVAPHSPWAFDEAVDDITQALTPLYRRAAEASPQKFINLDMEEYRDLNLTLAVFTRLLDQPELANLEAGIALQAYLPDAMATMKRLQEWAKARRHRGGAPIKVRVVKGANLPMERVDSWLHNWPLATWSSKLETDVNYKRVLDYALTRERIDNVHIGVAGHNLFDIALAWHLARARGVNHGVDFEMLLGMAPGQAEAVRRDVGNLLLYVPVVHPDEFDVALAYLVRRLDEAASGENFMSAVLDLHDDAALFDREKDRFLASLQGLDRKTPEPNRRQDRRASLGSSHELAPGEFHNTADTDPAIGANVVWAREILQRARDSDLGSDLVHATTVKTSRDLDALITRVVQNGESWRALSGRERAGYLRKAAAALERRRAELIEVMVAEAGKTFDQADPEVSEAIDFANYYATLAEELDTVDGATARPVRLTVVTPPWNFPVAIPTGMTLGALAAGSPVVVKPAPQTPRCGAVVAETLWQAGIPSDALGLVQLSESELGSQLVADPRVDRLLLTGAYDTAERFRSFRRDLPLLAETSGKNAIVVTPSADIDLAVKDVVASAFGHAGQKCSAASLVILVGSVASSRRFREQLVDAVTSLRVGPSYDPTTQMGPLIGPAEGKLLRALTELGPGESWVVAPRKLDAAGQLWSPGVKEGVQPGSEYHMIEYFGPVLGIMTAETLEQAIELQNQVPYGLTAGLHSLDPDEVQLWLGRVQAGNLYVNRGITGAIVRRQPFGGWKRSAVGPGAKAGGPNYLIGLCDWESAPATATATVPAGPARLLDAARAADLEPGALEFVERALRSDAAAWEQEFGTARDVTGLPVERNILRYLPHPVAIRACEGSTLAELLRVAAAGVCAGAPINVSTSAELPSDVRRVLHDLGVTLVREDDAGWLKRAGQLGSGRIRLLGGSVTKLYEAIGGRPDIAIYAQPVTESGRVELLPFLQEQAVSITTHRFGTILPQFLAITT
jgi:RHH-type proline utilization regulon transcriptional repressor/proline dehydrogenase/delta 1-pyrroline-5-carboxylate dehydrogenase